MKRRFFISLAGTVTVVALIFGPILFAFNEQAQMRNFRVVRPGVLYRSGQMTVQGLKRAIHDFGIRTVICLRGPASAADLEEEAFREAQAINFHRLAPQSWDTSFGPAPVEENVCKFRAILNDPANNPILIHCFAGIHRSGAYCAIYRMEKEHWTNDQAIAEMATCGYSNLYDEYDVLGYLEQYRPTWTRVEN
jgi:protein tyrosine/serine phosphatase